MPNTPKEPATIQGAKIQRTGAIIAAVIALLGVAAFIYFGGGSGDTQKNSSKANQAIQTGTGNFQAQQTGTGNSQTFNNYFAATNAPAPQQKIAKWQPPELPEGCKIITVNLGSGSGSSMEFPYDDLTNSVGRMNIGGIDVFGVYIKSNRLYVATSIPFATNPVPILMNNEMDGSIPADMDRNFNSTAFEIVDRENLPVLQVIYKRPNVIIVNGIFRTRNVNGTFTAFDSSYYEGSVFRMGGSPFPAEGAFNFEFAFTCDGTNMRIWDIKQTRGKNAVVKPTDKYYTPHPTTAPKPPTRKPLFKYPSSLHPGELAQ
jgi:hypothetical protein